MRKPGFCAQGHKLYKTNSPVDQDNTAGRDSEAEDRNSNERRQSLRKSTILQSIRYPRSSVQRNLNIVTPNNEIPPNTSINSAFESLRNIEEEKNSKSNEEFTDAITDTEIEKNMSNEFYSYDQKDETNDLRTIIIFKGKSTLIAQELIESIEKLKEKYQWDDDRTIQMFGSKLRGRKLLEWFYMTKRLPENVNNWEYVREAFERNYVNMSKIKRWKQLTKIKQRKGQSLEVYRGTFEKLVSPIGIVESEKVAIFIMG